MEQICPVCKKIANITTDGALTSHIECRLCGSFKATSEFMQFINFEGEKFSISEYGRQVELLFSDFRGITRERGIHKNAPVYLGWDSNPELGIVSLEDLIRDSKIPSTPMEKIERFLENIAFESRFKVGLRLTNDYGLAATMMYAGDKDECIYLLSAADKLGFFDYCSLDTGQYVLKLSLKAWEKIHENKSNRTNTLQVFIACDFKTFPEENINAIRTGIELSGYNPLCLKGLPHGETIISKAQFEIRRSRFLVADLTCKSESVIFEIGFALGLGLDVILIIDENVWGTRKSDLEFYVKHYVINRYKDLEELKVILESSIGARIH